MTRVLVLEGARLAILERVVDSVEPVDPEGEPGLWLPSVVEPSEVPALRRALRLRGGGRVEVPSAMRIADDVEILELPELLREIARRRGIVGLACLPEGLSLVCDPSVLAPEEIGRPAR